MASMEISHLYTQPVTNGNYSFNVAFPSGKPTGIIVVALLGRYSDLQASTVTIGGVSATKFAYEDEGYSHIAIYGVTGVTPGTKTIQINSTALHSHMAFVYCVTNCRGWSNDNWIKHNEISGTNTHSPTLEVGQLWVEHGRSRNTTYFTGGSGQSILASFNPDDGSTIVYRIIYKYDPGNGSQSFSVTYPSTTEQSYLGVEYLPFGRIFDIPPLAIG
jgi:hypothetical protein